MKMKTIRICDLGEIITGHTPPTKERDYYGDAYPLLKPTDMNLDERYSPTTAESVSEKWVALKQKTLIPRHATCVVTIGTIGKICITSKPCFTNQAVNAVIPDRSLFDEMYIYYLLKTIVPHVKHLSSGTASGRENVSKSVFSSIEVSVHDLSTQKKIASILSAYDDLIENNTRRIAILEETAQAIYREWFVNFRFPGHKNVKLVDSKLGMIPEGWSITSLENLTTKIGSGATPTGGKNAYKESGVTLIRSMNVYDNNFVDEGLAFIDDKQAEQLENVTVKKHDILLNITGASVARCCMVRSDLLPARVNQHVAIIRTDREKADPFFVLSAINSERLKKQLLSLAQGGATREALTKTTIQKFEILMPDAKTLIDFAGIAEASFEQRELLQRKNKNLRTTRDLLLPKLISGQLEVEEIDIDLGPAADELQETTA